MAAAQRADFNRSIGCPSTERIFSVWVVGENGCVSIESPFKSSLQCVPLVNVAEVLPNLKEVTEGAQDRSCRRVEGFVQPIGKFQRRLNLIRCREQWRASQEAK